MIIENEKEKTAQLKCIKKNIDFYNRESIKNILISLIDDYIKLANDMISIIEKRREF